MGFEFSSTAQCEYCGNYMSTSTGECDEHTVDELSLYYFRHLSTGDVFVVRSTYDHMWYKLADMKGEDFISWEFIGDRQYVYSMLSVSYNDSVEDIDRLLMSVDAPADVLD
jgi:hypothetical protein